MQIITIVRQALHTTRSQRQLWVFGLFAAGATSFNFSNSGGDSPSWLAAALVVAAVLGLLTLVAHLVSEAALIEGVAQSRDGGPTSIAVGARRGVRCAPRVGVIKGGALAAKLLTAAVVVLPIGVALMLEQRVLLGGILTAVLGVLSLPVFVTVHLLALYALRCAVLESCGVRESVAIARRFVSSRIVESLWLLLAQGAGSTVIALIGACIALPIAGVAGALYLWVGIVPAAVVGGILLVPVAFAIAGARGTYCSSLWTHSYLAERLERV